MKKWKKLLACLLAGLMALAVFTACDGSAGVPIGSKHSMPAAQRRCASSSA